MSVVKHSFTCCDDALQRSDYRETLADIVTWSLTKASKQISNQIYAKINSIQSIEKRYQGKPC